METFNVSTRSRSQLTDISSQVGEIIANSGVEEGIAVVYTPHTTAAITINENADPSVPGDISGKMDDVIEKGDPQYRHAEGNSDSHIKSSLFGCSEHLIIRNGRPVLGTWQGIFFCEFDGPRTRKVHVQVIGS